MESRGCIIKTNLWSINMLQIKEIIAIICNVKSGTTVIFFSWEISEISDSFNTASQHWAQAQT